MQWVERLDQVPAGTRLIEHLAHGYNCYFDGEAEVLAEGALRAERLEVSRVYEIKRRAGAAILAIAPEWKQRNMTARMVELNDKRDRQLIPLSSEEQAELDGYRAVWDRIHAIRARSNQAEAAGTASGDFEPEP